jgi:hypothetical protein
MNRIARTFAAVLVTAGLITAVHVQADASQGTVMANHQWCC